MARMQVAVIVIALFCAECLGEEDGGQEVKPAAFDVTASEGFEPVNISLPDNATTEGGDRKRASQYDCYVTSLGWKTHGEVFQMSGFNCLSYRCAYGRYDVVREACEASPAQCVPVGSTTVYAGCTKLRCAKMVHGNYWQYGFEVVGTPQCKVNGACYALGDTWGTGCQQRRCVTNGRPGGYTIQDVGNGDGCTDSTGRCWNRGDVFSDRLNGKYYSRCVCLGATRYQCYNSNGK